MEVDSKHSSDDEYEEEEILLYLDFQSKIKSDSLQERDVKIKMIGFETDEPIVQINNKMFRGTFEHAMGTNVFFTENLSPPPMDPNFEPIPPTMYKYHSQTNQVLKMERIFITPKKDSEEEEEGQEELIEKQTNEDDVVPKESYSDALTQFLRPGEPPPRILSGSDVLKPSEFQCFFRRMNVNEANDRTEEIVDEESHSNEVAEENLVPTELVEEEMVSTEAEDELIPIGVVEEGSDSMEINEEQLKNETIPQL